MLPFRNKLTRCCSWRRNDESRKLNFQQQIAALRIIKTKRNSLLCLQSTRFGIRALQPYQRYGSAWVLAKSTDPRRHGWTRALAYTRQELWLPPIQILPGKSSYSLAAFRPVSRASAATTLIRMLKTNRSAPQLNA